jgi:hypothetical protein
MSGIDQSDVIALLERPETYGEDVESVERIDTHTAIVFLASARAYKLKRSVKFPYLDFSTVELRRRFCEAELRLNRRTAPSLYLDVIPVTRGKNGALALGGAGTPVDWVVVMRRFAQEDLFDRMAVEGRLSLALMQDLADQIAVFHADAEINRVEGGAAGLKEVIRGNDVSLRACASAFDSADIAHLNGAALDWLQAVGELLDRRRDAGHVRLCHGDLHLRNICLIEGRPTLFDCVEFSRRLACIDVLYDLAFLLMDLHYRGFCEHANLVMNRYLDRTEEGDGLTALPLFLSSRAAIRAHTSAASAARQPNASNAQSIREEARSYLEAALRHLQFHPPMLVAIGGFSGTGKSTLARSLASELGVIPGARVLRSDVFRKRLMGVAPETRLGPNGYTDPVTATVYERLCAEAATVARSGFAVIADAVFAREMERVAIADTARAAGVKFFGLWLAAPPQVLERRLYMRGRSDASDADVTVLRRQLAYDTGSIEWIKIDASAADTAAVLAQARAALASSCRAAN